MQTQVVPNFKENFEKNISMLFFILMSVPLRVIPFGSSFLTEKLFPIPQFPKGSGLWKLPLKHGAL